MSAPRTSDDSAGIDADEQQQILKSLWKPHPGQRAVLEHDARFRVVSCGRRWGKSEMAAHEAMSRALETVGATIWWVGPTYDDANDYGFDKMTPLISPDVLASEPKRTKPRKIEFDTGSTVSFRSAEREDSLRGGGVDFLIIDESSSIPKRAWTEELRPTLSDTLGDALFIGTPKGKNWFHDYYRRGQSSDHPDVASWQAPTHQNPHVLDSEIDSAKEDVPDRVFRQEYLAEFVDDAGGVFRGVRDSVQDYALPVDPDAATQPFAIGVDFARLENYTAICVLDRTGKLVAFKRMRETTWTRIQATIEQLADEYRPARVSVDASRDNKIVQDLEDSGLDVEPVTFSTSRKRTLIDNLATRLEGGEMVLSSDASELINELEVFEYDMTASGNISYHAPSGFKDDSVDALALAAEGSRTRPTRRKTRRGTPNELAKEREQSDVSSSSEQTASGPRREVRRRSPGGR